LEVFADEDGALKRAGRRRAAAQTTLFDLAADNS